MENAVGSPPRSRRAASSILAGIVVVGITLAVGLSARSPSMPESSKLAVPHPQTTATATATGAVESFLAALEDMNVGDAGKLFSGRARIFESGVDQGDWAHYAQGHLMVEFGNMKALTIRRGQFEEIRRGDDPLVIVIWPVEVDVTWGDGRITRNTATATFVLRAQDGAYLIEHMHWSSRPIGSDPH